jgi:hypothetical protein
MPLLEEPPLLDVVPVLEVDPVPEVDPLPELLAPELAPPLEVAEVPEVVPEVWSPASVVSFPQPLDPDWLHDAMHAGTSTRSTTDVAFVMRPTLRRQQG